MINFIFGFKMQKVQKLHNKKKRQSQGYLLIKAKISKFCVWLYKVKKLHNKEKGQPLGYLFIKRYKR